MADMQEGVSMNTVIYTNSQGSTRPIPIGQDHNVKRQEGDIVLTRAIAIDLPLKIAIQITAEGAINWWYTEPGDGSVYWHFSNMPYLFPEQNPERVICTPAQRTTLKKMNGGEIDLWGLRGALGHPVIQWAFGEEAANLALEYHT